MLDCFDHAKCEKDNAEKCGNTLLAQVYFITFYLFYAFLVSARNLSIIGD